MIALLKVTPVQSVSKGANSFQQNHSEEFQNILQTEEKKYEVDTDHVYDKDTNEIVSDLDNMDHNTLKNLLREE